MVLFDFTTLIFISLIYFRVLKTILTNFMKWNGTRSCELFSITYGFVGSRKVLCHAAILISLGVS